MPDPFETQVGSFTKDNTGINGATQDVTLNFTPKAVIVWAQYRATAYTDADGDMVQSVGFTDGTNHGSVSSNNLDNNGTMNCVSNTSATYTIVFPNFTGGYYAYGTVTFGTNKFTVTWNLNDFAPTIIHYIAYGGDEVTGAEVGKDK